MASSSVQRSASVIGCQRGASFESPIVGKAFCYRTEQCYVSLAERFIRFHGIRHPDTMGEPEVEAFLTDLAVNGRVSASTQNQALGALLFLYRNVLGRELGRLDAVRAQRP